MTYFPKRKIQVLTGSAAKMPVSKTANPNYSISQTISAFSTKFQSKPATKPGTNKSQSFGKLELIFQPTAKPVDPEAGVKALKDMIFNQRQEIDELNESEAALKRQVAEKE